MIRNHATIRVPANLITLVPAKTISLERIAAHLNARMIIKMKLMMARMLHATIREHVMKQLKCAPAVKEVVIIVPN